MYVIATVTLQAADGTEDDYEVGADVEPYCSSYYVGEPEISAPGEPLKTSRLASDPQGGGVFADGWSEHVEEALIDSYIESRYSRGQ